MNYFESAPSYRLAPYIKTYWFLEGSIPAGYLQPERIFPDGCMELIIHYGDAFHKINGQHIEKQANSFVFGQLEEFIELLPSSSTGVMGIKFYPQGLAPFTRVPINEFSQRAVELSHLFKSGYRQLEEMITGAKDGAERVQLIERFLLACLQPPDKNGDLINAVVTDIYRAKGAIAVHELSRQYKTSERQLERRFLQEVGLTPKTFSRIIRFQQVFALAPGAASLTGLALEAGYFDQAHFNREFKAFTGLSPRQYFKGRFDFTSYFIND